MAASDWINTTGDTPTFKPLAAASGVLATILYGWYAGFLDFIGSAGGGIWGTIDAIRRFLASPTIVWDENGVHPEGVIQWLFSIPGNAIDAVVTENVRWLSTFGAAAQLVATIEVAVLVVLLWWTVSATVRRFLGGL